MKLDEFFNTERLQLGLLVLSHNLRVWIWEVEIKKSPLNSPNHFAALTIFPRGDKCVCSSSEM